MLKNNEITYVAPPFESVQHDITLVDENGKPKHVSFHSDVSLMMRIDNMRINANTYQTIKDALQPYIDKSQYRSQIEDAFGSLSDDELMKSCPSRYLSTASEKMAYLRSLAKSDQELRSKVAAQNAKEVEDKKRSDEERQLREELDRYLSNFRG